MALAKRPLRPTHPTGQPRAKVEIRREGLDPQRISEVAALYDAGWSSGRLAKRFGVSANTVLKALRTANVTIKARQGGPAGKTSPI